MPVVAFVLSWAIEQALKSPLNSAAADLLVERMRHVFVCSSSAHRRPVLAALQLHSTSAQVRTGGPKDEQKDMDLDIWAGVLNMRSFVPGSGEADAQLKAGVPEPSYVTKYRRPSEVPNGIAELTRIEHLPDVRPG